MLPIPTPPRFHDFSFKSIGHPPNLLQRFSDAPPPAEHPLMEDDPMSASDDEHTNTPNQAHSTKPLSRPSLWQALAEPSSSNVASSSSFTNSMDTRPSGITLNSTIFDQPSTSSTQEKAKVPSLSTDLSASASLFSSFKSASLFSSSPTTINNQSTSDSPFLSMNLAYPSQSPEPPTTFNCMITNSPSALSVPRTGTPDPTNSNTRPPLMTRSYSELRDMMSKLSDHVDALKTQRLSTALVLADNANQQATIVMAEGRRLYELQKELQTTIQRSLVATEALISAAEECKSMAEGSKAELTRISSKENSQQRTLEINEVQELLLNCENWIKNRENDEAALRTRQQKLRERKAEIAAKNVASISTAPGKTLLAPATPVTPVQSTFNSPLVPVSASLTTNGPGRRSTPLNGLASLPPKPSQPLFFSSPETSEVSTSSTPPAGVPELSEEELAKRQVLLRKKLEEKRKSSSEVDESMDEPEKRPVKVARRLSRSEVQRQMDDFIKAREENERKAREEQEQLRKEKELNEQKEKQRKEREEAQKKADEERERQNEREKGGARMRQQEKEREEAQKKAEAERLRREEKEKEAVQKKAEEERERKRRVAEAQAKAEEKKRHEDEAKRISESEAAAKAKEKAEEEKKRLEELTRRNVAEAKRREEKKKAETEERKREEEVRRQVEEERKRMSEFVARQKRETEEAARIAEESKQRRQKEQQEKEKQYFAELRAKKAEKERQERELREKEEERQQVERQQAEWKQRRKQVFEEKTKSWANRAQEVRAQRERPEPSSGTTTPLDPSQGVSRQSAQPPRISTSNFANGLHMSPTPSPLEYSPTTSDLSRQLPVPSQQTVQNSFSSSGNQQTSGYSRQVSLPPVAHFSPSTSPVPSPPTVLPFSAHRQSRESGNVPIVSQPVVSPQAQAFNLRHVVSALNLPPLNIPSVKVEVNHDDSALLRDTKDPDDQRTAPPSSSSQIVQDTHARPSQHSPVNPDVSQSSANHESQQQQQQQNNPPSFAVEVVTHTGRTPQGPRALIHQQNSQHGLATMNGHTDEDTGRREPRQAPYPPRLSSPIRTDTYTRSPLDRSNNSDSYSSSLLNRGRPETRTQQWDHYSPSRSRSPRSRSPPRSNPYPNVYRPTYPRGQSPQPIVGRKRSRDHSPIAPMVYDYRDHRDFDEQVRPKRRSPPRRIRRDSPAPRSPPSLALRLTGSEGISIPSRPDLLDRFSDPRNLSNGDSISSGPPTSARLPPKPGRRPRRRGGGGGGGNGGGVGHPTLEQRISSGTTLMHRIEDPPRRS